MNAGRRGEDEPLVESAEVEARAGPGTGLEVAVVGAGAVGATVAYDLARQGVTVTLYDRGPVASGATGRAAGVCYDAFADRFDAELASDAIERFRTLSGDDTFPFVECPYVWFAREGDSEMAAAVAEGVARMQEVGVVAVEMDGEGLGERFPAIETDDVTAAGVAGAAGYTDPAGYTATLAAAATGAGATLESETAVAVRTDPPRVLVGVNPGETGGAGDSSPVEREVDAVVVAAGAHAGPLLADAGVPIATAPYRVQALTAGLGGATLQEPMWYDATDGWYGRPHADGVLAGDGTEPVPADPDDWDRDADASFTDSLVDQIAERFPAAEPTVERAWAGLCTATPDGDPLVGAVADGLYVATGFHGEGVMRAPAVGQRLASQVLAREGDGRNEADLSPYDPTRFDGDEPVERREGMALDSDR